MFSYQKVRPLQSICKIANRAMSSESPIQNTLKTIFLKSVEAVKPAMLVENALTIEKSADTMLLKIKSDKNKQTTIIDITHRNVHCIGFGKAVHGMAVAVEKALSTKLRFGVVSIPKKFDTLSQHMQSGSVIKVYEGAENNLPDQAAEGAAREIKQLAQAMTSNDVLIVLISGGGSALLPIPISSVTLAEKIATIKLLANGGATINELNVVRIALSDVKGGKLLEAAKDAHFVVSLILSDIVNDPIELIASGPTVLLDATRSPSPSSILDKYKLVDKVPKSVLTALAKDVKPVQRTYNNSSVHVIGSNAIAVGAAADEAKKLGLHPVLLSRQVQGHIKDLAKTYVDLAILVIKLRNGKLSEDGFKEEFESTLKVALFVDNNDVLNQLIEAKSSDRMCLIAGGEPTATVTGSGKGGRNQELALRFTQECQRRKKELQPDNVLFLAAGTDGIDGPTSAAGAIGGLLVAASAENLLISDFLTNSDSFAFYESIANGEFHIITGHTGTNVMDLHLLAIA